MDIERRFQEMLWHETFGSMARRLCDAAHKDGVSRSDIVKVLNELAAEFSTEPPSSGEAS
jgi:hypothetical protein